MVLKTGPYGTLKFFIFLKNPTFQNAVVWLIYSRMNLVWNQYPRGIWLFCCRTKNKCKNLDLISSRITPLKIQDMIAAINTFILSYFSCLLCLPRALSSYIKDRHPDHKFIHLCSFVMYILRRSHLEFKAIESNISLLLLLSPPCFIDMLIAIPTSYGNIHFLTQSLSRPLFHEIYET